MNNPTTIEQLRLAAIRGQGYAADVAEAAAEAIEELERTKADKPQSLTATLAAAGWTLEETGDPETGQETGQGGSSFQYLYDIPAPGVTAADRADVTIGGASMETARACGFCTVTETLAGAIRVRAQLRPEADILAACSIKKGANQ